jgi:hypothetical protein
LPRRRRRFLASIWEKRRPFNSTLLDYEDTMTEQYSFKFAHAALMLYSSQDEFELEFASFMDRDVAEQALLSLGSAVCSEIGRPRMRVLYPRSFPRLMGKDFPTCDANYHQVRDLPTPVAKRMTAGFRMAGNILLC